jgi:D-3-phosphoglycerate dehydrogenase
MVREGRWKEGRPQLLQIPRLMGQTLGFIAFGHVARAVAMRARGFGVRMLAYDPYIEELVMSPYGVEPASLSEVLQRSDIVSMHAPATPDATRMMTAEHFRQMKPTALFINTGRGPTVDESALVKALRKGGSRAPASTCWAGAAGAGQPAPHDGQRDPDRAWPRPPRASIGAAAAGGARDLAGAERRWPRSCVTPRFSMAPACAAGSRSRWSAGREPSAGREQSGRGGPPASSAGGRAPSSGSGSLFRPSFPSS